MHRYRSHTCGELRETHVGATARLSGWVHRVRDHGGLLFIDLRDHYGMTQCVIDPDSPAFKLAETVRAEWCLRIDGEVKMRTPETVNETLPTGAIEIFIRELEVLGSARELPLPVFNEPDYPEDIRLTYRFLDLRRETLHENIMTRTRIIGSMRQRMGAAGFTEFQTPILTASSPEGARDFLVPSRLHPGKFYALPQAPQQFKQLLMVSGFDRYFQIAPCFRDEDPRADRLPGEFYQLDLEMSFVEQEDVFSTMEPIMRGIFEEFAKGKPVTGTFPRIPYADAIAKYGSDKPDLRNPIEMQDVGTHFAGSGFKIFARLLEDTKNAVWAIPAPTGGSRAFCDRMNSWAQGEGQPGLGYIFWREGEVWVQRKVPNMSPSDLTSAIASGEVVADHAEPIDQPAGPDGWEKRQILEAAGPLAKNIGEERTDAIRTQLGLKAGDAAFFVAGDPKKFSDFAGKARTRVGEELDLIDRDRFALAWIVDFPFFEWDEEEKKVEFAHNPFSMPQGGLDALETMDPLDIKAFQYDLVCNGYEIASGSIRNQSPELMVKAFEKVGLSKNDVEERFGGLYRAFQYGAPPHGGMAAGVDRIVMLLVGAKNVRDVSLFPMNQQAQDLLMGAPSDVYPKQLRELHIRLNLPEKG